MYQLKAAGKIDHITFSVFTKQTIGFESSIKFGSMDQEGISMGGAMSIYKTIDLGQWAIKSSNFKANGHDISKKGERNMKFSLHLPYVYIPDKDFTELAIALSLFNLDINCGKTGNYCKFSKPCSDVNMGTWYLSFDLFDDSTLNNYALPFSSYFMIDGETFGDKGTCYFPVFKSGVIGDQDSWYIGNMFIRYFYLSFDMSPHDEKGKDYI